jgi:hypothetical protein
MFLDFSAKEIPIQPMGVSPYTSSQEPALASISAQVNGQQFRECLDRVNLKTGNLLYLQETNFLMLPAEILGAYNAVQNNSESATGLIGNALKTARAVLYAIPSIPVETTGGMVDGEMMKTALCAQSVYKTIANAIQVLENFQSLPLPEQLPPEEEEQYHEFGDTDYGYNSDGEPMFWTQCIENDLGRFCAVPSQMAEVEELDTRTDEERAADLAEIRAGYEGGSESGGDGDRPVSQGGQIPDEDYYRMTMSDDEFIDPMAGAYPTSQFNQTTPAAIALEDYRTQYTNQDYLPLASTESQYTLLDTSSTTATSTTMFPDDLSVVSATTETATTEEPKQGGLGILAIGLIALKVLAT